MRTCFAILALVWAVVAQASPATAEDGAPWLQITFEDGSLLKAALADDAIPLQTRYGLLTIPSHEVRRIAFATRPSADEATEIARAIAMLDRDPTAKATLIQAGEQALPSLVAAARSDRLALTATIRDVIAAIAEAHKGPLVVRDCDELETTSGTIRGTITLPALQIRTSQFGLLTLHMADARSIGPPQTARVETVQPMRRPKGQVQPNPGNLTAFADRVGQIFLFEVTGANHGTVWGTDTYTSDSDLAAAAVHAGVLELNQTGVVEVQIAPGLKAYRGSTRHGITTHSFGPYNSSYRVRKASQQVPFRLFQWWLLR